MTDRSPPEPKPGFYRHYKGGFYRLLLVADHHEHDGRRVAVYRSLERGTLSAQQVAKNGPDDREDCWSDLVDPLKTGIDTLRFQFVGEEEVDYDALSLADLLPDDWDVHAKYDGETGHRYIDAAVEKIAVLEERVAPPYGDGPCPGCGVRLGEIDNAHTWKDCAGHLRDLLRRCQSGGEDASAGWCPICGEKWRDGDAQPHAPDCELARAIGA
jgi:hypothetical protein